MPRKDAAQLDSLRQRLANTTGKKYWRSLEELTDDEEFRRWLGREFPEQAAQWSDIASRRRFLKLMAASLALAGLQGCRQQPHEQLVPYVEAPPEVTPGVPLIYASAMPMSGDAVGVLVESHEGRPTMLEGNPQHPSCANPEHRSKYAPPGIFAQASLLTLYDPDRSQTVLRQGVISTWGEFLANLRPRLEAARANGGRGLRILTETVTSPTLAWQLERLLGPDHFPEAQWYQWEPVHRDSELAGAELAFGQPVHAVYHFDRADVVLSLGADFLGARPGQLRYSRDFALRRRPRLESLAMNRLYVAESTLSITGAKADHRLALRPAEIEALARVLASRLGVEAAPAPPLPPGVSEEWLAALVEDLQNPGANGQGASVIVAGREQPPAVHALVHAMNAALNAGRGEQDAPVTYVEPPAARAVSHVEQIAALTDELNRGEVELLLILGGNPVYNAPADLNFAQALAKAPFRVHTSLYVDETSAACPWHLPETHWLESWSDVRAFNGAASIVQPLIRPLYNGAVSRHTVLEAFLGDEEADPYNVVRSYWQRQLTGEDARADRRPFETAWRTAVHDGLVAGTQGPSASVALAENWAANLPAWEESPQDDSPRAVEVVFRPDPTIYDGSFANNGWLQELPKPLTKLTWDNAALVSPKDADDWGLSLAGEVVEIEVQEGDYRRTVRIPALVAPGHPEGVVTLHLGYGRERVGRVGEGAGANVYPLRTANNQWFARATLRPARQRRVLARTQHHFSMEGRPLVQDGTLEEWRDHPEHPEFLAVPHGDEDLSFYGQQWKYEDYKWGMVIDTTACIGCGACTLACQAENNIPIVGKTEVARGREMHWIRVDHYYEGEPEDPAVHHLPVPCMHCELAPCEPVCPVAATVHSSEGLNEMVYNRCVGTRYCSNNCPYKVRRFNFLQYSDATTPVLKLLRNPDVTVRNRGVMEKCTYCVQRIAAARIHVEKERARSGDPTIPMQDGAVATACQAACPTEAIIFGDLNDRDSRVAKLARQPINYALLEELNTRPRTTYLAEIRNPNPRIERAVEATDGKKS